MNIGEKQPWGTELIKAEYDIDADSWLLTFKPRWWAKPVYAGRMLKAMWKHGLLVQIQKPGNRAPPTQQQETPENTSTAIH